MLITEAFRVLACLCAGEVLSGVGLLPFPGAVIGLVFLLANLALIGDVPKPLGRLADNVLAVLGMLFVSTGVGLLAYTHLLRTDASFACAEADNRWHRDRDLGKDWWRAVADRGAGHHDRNHRRRRRPACDATARRGRCRSGRPRALSPASA